MIHSFVDNDEATKWKFYKLLIAVYLPMKVWNPGNYFQFLQPCFIIQLITVVGKIWKYWSRRGGNHHQILLLLVEHRASMKSFQALRSPPIPLTSFHDLLVLLISSSIVLCHVLFGLPLLLYPWGFHLMQFSVLLLFLYVMCVQSNSIFFFSSDFLVTSDGWFSIVLRS